MWQTFMENDFKNAKKETITKYSFVIKSWNEVIRYKE